MVVTTTVVILLIGLFTLDLAQIGISGENRFSSVRLEPITPETPSAQLKCNSLLGLGQTSNFLWDEPNSNLGQPKLS